MGRWPDEGSRTAVFGRFASVTVVAVALLLLSNASVLAQTAAATATPRTQHAPVHRATPPRTASAGSAVDASDRPALPRLIAIAAPEDDDAIARFALYAARDIEQLGLQFPAQTANGSTDTEVVITMSLRDSASARMRDFSRQHMNEPMTLIVDGVEMITATIRSELGGKFQLQMPKEKGSSRNSVEGFDKFSYS
ncbi:hypothetical protein [Pandoraea oxalativorans]|uniref:Uncharacterized protein n=1 Tax=Pandoraea oxalativorans TaxID=573737 RepID=A0A0G3IB98_9BURK|nr:hypothetical protein [Pandoraea oxalativorans]AKK23876.1 hypothetical protein MB84_25060 [Pandoraea oxalativorans]